MSPGDRMDDLATGLVAGPVSVGRQLNEERTGVRGGEEKKEDTLDELIAQAAELSDDSASVILKLRALVSFALLVLSAA
jgi:hypothetical protein